MTDQTLNLSDGGNEVAYPDVEHPDPPELPPDALTVPPPLEQRHSTLLDLIRAYATGETDWPTARQALIDFPYEDPPARLGQPVGPSKGDWYNDVEADIGTSAPDNTWAQLQEATNIGLLTRAERNEVLQARADRGGGGGDGGQPTPPQRGPAEAKALPFDAAKHPRGGHGRWARVKLGNAERMLAGGTESEKVMVEYLKPGDVILHPGTEWHEPVVVTQNLAHPRKVDPHMQWRAVGLHNGKDEQIIDKVHHGDYVDRILNVPDPTSAELVPAGAPTARRTGSQQDAQTPMRLPRPRRTTPFDNGTPVVHQDGRVGRIRHVTVSALRPGHTLVNPVTGSHSGYVTDVRVSKGGTGKFDQTVTDKTPLGMERLVEVDGEPQGVMSMGARYSVFEPYDETPAPPAGPPPFSLAKADQSQVADAISNGTARIRSEGGNRVWVDHRVTELSYDRVPSGPREGEWHGAYISTYGNTSGEHPHRDVTHPGLIRHLDAARNRQVALAQAKSMATKLSNDGVDYDEAEGRMLDYTARIKADEELTDAIMAHLDSAYGR